MEQIRDTLSQVSKILRRFTFTTSWVQREEKQRSAAERFFSCRKGIASATGRFFPCRKGIASVTNHLFYCRHDIAAPLNDSFECGNDTATATYHFFHCRHDIVPLLCHINGFTNHKAGVTYG